MVGRESKFSQVMGELKVLSANMTGLSVQMKEVKDATATVKWNIMVTGLAIGGLIIGISAFGFQILDLAQGLFAAGASTK